MEQGSMRADVNISLRRPGAELGTRAEIKNVNSVRFMGQAIQYEISRQMEILENGGIIVQETRLFDAVKGETRSMRSKENAHDYRYFPDPDLPPLIVSQEMVDQIKADLPELPDQKKNRYQCDFGLSPYNADVLSNDFDTAVYFETAIKYISTDVASSAKLLANWIAGELFAVLNKENITIDASRISAHNLTKLIELIAKGKISGKIAKDVFVLMWEHQSDPVTIVQEQGMLQISDDKAILAAIDCILAENPDKVAEYRSGKDKLFGFFVGQVMRHTQGKANPTLLNEILKKQLDG